MLTHRLTCQGQEASDHSQEDEHLGSAEGKEGEDEADDQDDEATEECGSGCPSPCCERKETVINKTDDVPNSTTTYQSMGSSVFSFY